MFDKRLLALPALLVTSLCVAQTHSPVDRRQANAVEAPQGPVAAPARPVITPPPPLPPPTLEQDQRDDALAAGGQRRSAPGRVPTAPAAAPAPTSLSSAPAAAPPYVLKGDMGGLTISHLAAIQREALELEAAKKASLTQPPPAPTVPAVVFRPPAPPKQKLTLTSLVVIKGEVRNVEMVMAGQVIPIKVGQTLSGWRVVGLTPEGVRVMAGKRSVTLKPGDSVEAQ